MHKATEKKTEKGKGRDVITSTLRYLADGLKEADDLFGLWAGYTRSRKSMFCERSQKKSSRRRLSYLKEKDLVKVRKMQDKLFVELSKKGEEELASRTLRDRRLLPFEQVCIVMYDFPISAKKGRDAFRAFLKRAGFSKRQMSVWECEKDVFQDIQKFVDRAKIGQWVEIFLAKKQ